MATASWAAVVEIVADPATGALPVALITSAYRASVAGPVAFVLEGIDPATVDRVLDAVVGDPLEVHGVRYCSPAELPALVSQAGLPRVVVARTEALHKVLEGLALLPVPEMQALAALADLEDGPFVQNQPSDSPSPFARGASRTPAGYPSI